MAVGTAVETANLGWRAHDDLHTAVGGVVLAGTLLSVHVTKRIGVVLLELIVRGHLAEGEFEESGCVLQLHACALEEQTIL